MLATKPVKKNSAAQDLARKRWDKATKKDRKKQGELLAEGRRKARKKRRNSPA